MHFLSGRIPTGTRLEVRGERLPSTSTLSILPTMDQSYFAALKNVSVFSHNAGLLLA